LPRDHAADISVCGAAATIEGTIMLTARMFSKTALLAIAVCAFTAAGARAQQATEINLSYKDKKFHPGDIRGPANTPIVIKLKNLDSQAMEFESKTLRVEKVVAGNSEAVINVRPQKPGRYEFFDEYNERTSRGGLVIE
jgi:hypothetical protein